jgi:hypothetical protein
VSARSEVSGSAGITAETGQQSVTSAQARPPPQRQEGTKGPTDDKDYRKSCCREAFSSLSALAHLRQAIACDEPCAAARKDPLDIVNHHQVARSPCAA